MGENGSIFDPNDPVELARLITLESALTRSMGLLSGIPETFEMRNVLDLACGPGGWVLDMAFEYPDVEVAGVDISRSMIDYATARARSQQRTNASFEQMDITHALDFVNGAFDMINARFLVGVLKREQWTPLLAECVRLLRPGGMIRVVETDGLVVSTSSSLARLQGALLHEMQARGYGFSPDGSTLGITPVLPRLLKTVGFGSIMMIPFLFDTSCTSPYYTEGLHLAELTYRQALRQHLLTRIQEERVEEFIRQMLIEMQQNTFSALTYGMTVCGIKLA